MIGSFKGNPFFLNEEKVRWVRQTLASMSEEDKLRQLFCLVTYESDEDYCRYIGEKIRPGGFMSRVMSADQCRQTVERMQNYSRIPLLVAANFEAGGNGMASEGTAFAKPMEIAATGDAGYARLLGEICGREGSALGANWSFAPIADIDSNWRNPITNTRTFGSDPETVCKMSLAYLGEIQKHGMAACIKHFPGDGCDEHDQHVAPSVNSLSCKEWDASYGAIYRAAIGAGVKTVMIGHILLPSYAERYAPSDPDAALLPASVNPAIVTDLLRRQLGFDGLIVSDSSVMSGVSALLPRKELVPRVIAAGCDMILFTRNLEEDIAFMREGYEKGIFDRVRLDDAVCRILALKASLDLPEKQKNGRLVPPPKESLAVFGNRVWQKKSRECAADAITLVKEEEGVLPLTPEKYPRVLFYPLETKTSGASVFQNESDVNGRFCAALQNAGFFVTVFHPEKGFEGMMTPIRETEENYDLIVYSAALSTRSNQTVVRIEWENPMGANVPTFVHTVPTVFVSFENPYHLADVPQIRTYINCYCSYPAVVDALMEKLTGKDGFRGRSPCDPFCGKWEAHAMTGKTARKPREKEMIP